ncbi:MAG: DUF3962 domain-containing protein [Rivularia sp. T60_A2020_040]|nr:DUF3962 domain-containing protein [Rivularia sp. T60_A2020_040]
MSAQYNKIRLCAFQLKHNLPEKQFYALKFPQEAKDLIKNLVAVRDNRSSNKVSIPITSLNAALRASIPGLIYIEKIWGKKSDKKNTKEKFWLYSPVEIPTDKLLAGLKQL